MPFLSSFLRSLVASAVAFCLFTSQIAGQNLDCSLLPPIGFPLLGDASGWNKPEYYSTIRTMDIDGDSIQELMARGPSGLQVFKWDAVGGMWASTKNILTALSDANKYNDPKYYRSMQFGDVDADGANELLIRGPDGLHTWKYTAATDSWKEIAPVLMDLGDTNCSDPSCYTTIQFSGETDIRALMVRRNDGLHFYAYTANGWVVHPTQPVIPLTGADWTRPEYYSTIQWAALSNSPARNFVMARAANGLHVWSVRSVSGGWSELDLLPDLSDARGWNQEKYYSSLQTVYVLDPSVGPAYLVARSANGASLYRLDDSGRRWQTAGTIPDLNDSAFGQPQFYRSLKSGRVDGDYDRLFAMGKDGLSVWKHNDDDTWSVMTKTPIISQDRGWLLPNSTTLQVAWISNINNQPEPALLGRSPNNIITLRYEAGSGLVPALVAGFPAFFGPELIAYQFISRKLGFSNPDNDIRAHYPSDVDWGIRYTQIDALKGTTPPVGVTPDQFEEVRARLGSEVNAVADAYDWFKNSLNFITDVYGGYPALVDFVSARLAQDPADSSPVWLNVISLLLGIVGSLAGFVGVPEVGLIGSILGTALTAGTLGPAGPNGLSPAANKIKDSLIQQKQNAEDGNACLSNAVMQNAGLLNAFETGIRNGTLNWNSVKVQDMRDAAERGYKFWLYQTLSPITWRVRYGCEPLGAFQTCSPRDYPDKYMYYPAEFPKGATWLSQLIPNTNISPKKEGMDEIFGAAPAGYAIPLEDVFRNRNGWELTGWFADNRNASLMAGDPALPAVRQLRDTVSADVTNDAEREKLVEPLREAIRLLRLSSPSSREAASHALELFAHRSKAYEKSQGREIMGGKHQSLAHEIRSQLLNGSAHADAAIARGGLTNRR